MSAGIVYSGLLIIVMCLMSACARPERARVITDVSREVRPRPLALAFAQERRVPELHRSRGEVPRDR